MISARAGLKSVWLLATLFLLAACADSAPSKGSDGDAGAGGTGVIPTGGMMPTAPPTAPGTDPPEPGSATLQVVGETTYAMGYNSRLDLRVRYFDATAQPKANAMVSASMIDVASGADVTGAGLGGTTLGASTAVTDAGGDALFTLNAGGNDVEFYVKFTAPGVTEDPADQVRVRVQRAGEGTLVVKAQYVAHGRNGGGRYTFRELTSARVSIYNQSCDALLAPPATPQRLPPAHLQLNPIMPFDAVNNQATQEGLNAGAMFSVVAVALTADNTVLAFGCVTGVTIVGGEDTVVQVPLLDLPLQYKGEYQVVHRFDLTDMLTNSGVPALETVDQVLEVIGILGNANGDRGQALIDLFCDLVDVGQGICDAVGLVGGRVIDNLIEMYVPAEILNVLNIVGDIYSIVSDLTIVGELVLNPNEADVNLLQADNRWQKFQFVWRNGCMDPNPANCIKQFDIGPEGEARPIAGLFDATICDTSAPADQRPAECPMSLMVTQILIPEHSFNVHYGTILLAVAEQWIIPAVLGATGGVPVEGPVSVQDLLGQLLPCESINNSIGAGSTFCEDVLVTALADLIVQQLSRLDLEVNQFTLRGSVEPADTNADLNIDRLNNGVWTGEIAFTADAMIPFRGCFTGCRKEFDENRRLIDCPEVQNPCTIPDAP
jgi:hypothetical protein